MALWAPLRDAFNRLLATFHVGAASTTEVASIDGLRAMAVSLVVVLHCWGVAGGPALYTTIPLLDTRVWLGEWIHQGELGIALFFILSGFLLGQPFFRAALSGEPRPALKSYFRRRVLRLVPAYYACLFLILILLTPSAIPAEKVYSWDGLKALLAHLTFTHFLFVDTGAYFRADAAMWTLTHEATFYLILPWVAVLFVGKRSLVALPGALLVTVAWLYLAHHSLDFWVNSVWQGAEDKLFFSHATIRSFYIAPQFPAHAFNFALGLSLGNFFVMTQLGRARRPHPLLALAFFALGCVLLAGWVHFFDFTRSSISADFTFVGTPAETIGLTLILAGVVFGAPVVTQAFSLAPIRMLGIISYSAFLWHGPLLYVLERYPSIQALPQEQRLLPILIRLVPMLLAVSIASYLLIEKPFLLAARRPRSAQAAAPAQAAVPVAPPIPAIAVESAPPPPPAGAAAPALAVTEPEGAP